MLADVSALAHVHALSADGAQGQCLMRLDADDVDPGPDETRLAWIDARCYAVYPIVRNLHSWTPIAGGGLRLMDSAKSTIIEFRPVTDGAGDRMSGATGDGKTYTLSTPDW
ncbi:MAG: hypothetical protein JNJ73_03590 [Hyphomonadaceae bacterium]|nr:hypothetical protein [Hyphomonadaceae bacterium]